MQGSKLGTKKGESQLVALRLTDEQFEFVEKQGEGNKSQYIRDLIDKAMKKK